jgi:hypothetical protein
MFKFGRWVLIIQYCIQRKRTSKLTIAPIALIVMENEILPIFPYSVQWFLIVKKAIKKYLLYSFKQKKDKLFIYSTWCLKSDNKADLQIWIYKLFKSVLKVLSTVPCTYNPFISFLFEYRLPELNRITMEPKFDLALSTHNFLFNTIRYTRSYRFLLASAICKTDNIRYLWCGAKKLSVECKIWNFDWLII